MRIINRDDIRSRYLKWYRKNEERHRQRLEFHHQKTELMSHIRELQRKQAELNSIHRHIRVFPPIIVVLNLLVWYFVFRTTGIEAIGILLAILLSMGGFFEFFFHRKIEKSILIPIGRLKNGVEEISKGNYDVKVECDVTNDMGMLIKSFNTMAEKLHESEKIKAEYEDNRKMLIANISHDLKTPITSMQGYIEAITEDAAISPENMARYLKIIGSNAAYINKLIDDLFMFSKLDMQKLEFEFVQMNVRPFIRDLMEEFKLELDERQIGFGYKDGLENDCNVKIDRKRMHQIFRNIIDNAVKHGPAQGLSIDVELYRREDSVLADIRDNGPGIAEDKLPHIFDRFYRIDAERTKDITSTGLGLAIARELAEAHGGGISVSSEEGAGACFTIRLPVAADPVGKEG